MKKLACLLVFFALGISALMAQSLDILGYQAVVRDNANKLVTEQNIVLDITISVNSTVEYTETRTVHSNKNGMVSFAIGDADRSSHTNELSDISDWKHAVVQVVYHLTAAQGGDVTTTDPITATPYALQADTASVVNPTYINNVVADSIADPNSVINLAIDTIVGNAFNGLCDSIKNNCSSIAFQNEANNFSEKNTFTDTVKVTGTAMVPTILDGDGKLIVTTGNVDSCLMAINYCDMKSYVSNTISDSLADISMNCDNVKDCVVKGLRTETETINNVVDSLVMKNVIDSIKVNSSALNYAVDTIVENHLGDYKIQDCEDVTNCVDAALRTEGSQTNTIVDSIIDTRISKAAADSLMTQTAVQTAIHDSIVYNISRQIHDSIAANAFDCDDVAECIISNEDAQKNIIKIVSDTMANGNSELNHIVDTIAAASQVNADWNATSGKAQILNKPTTISGYGITDASINTTTRVITLGTNTITVPEITTNNITSDNLCEKIAAAACPSIAYLANDNTFTGENTFSDNTKFSDTVVVPDVINADSTFSSGDSTQAVNALDVQKYVAKATSEKQTSFKVASAAAGQIGFMLTIPTGYASVNSDTRLVQLYINGVYVGDNADGVVNVSGTAVTYVPNLNNGYVLVAGDRIQIVYWVKK